ncbi:hypothetical protein COCVIDRAFT_15271 [Bipolaris victoriae FI3]|uniref:Uncharacterized protein n=1 Tax=Bipolaris victoriae (strain FI3) TaxID=930091 RepID=W7ELW4_BIPV3|nr:hypothetical protein COCVIDRAFT_15271 [Bipolaris victoriae FI3]
MTSGTYGSTSAVLMPSLPRAHQCHISTGAYHDLLMAESFHSVVVQAHLAGVGGGVKGASKSEAIGSTRFPGIFARAIPEPVAEILQDREASLDTPHDYCRIILEPLSALSNTPQHPRRSHRSSDWTSSADRIFSFSCALYTV